MIALALPNLVCGENKEKTEQKNKILELKQKHLAWKCVIAEAFTTLYTL